MVYTAGKYQHVELSTSSSRDSSPVSALPRQSYDAEQQYVPSAGEPPQDYPEKNQALFESDLPPVKHWPQSQNVAALTPLRTIIIVFDFVLASSPVMFIVLALIAAHIDGKETSEYGQHLNQALLLSPTIFPILFAALMGRCFRALALFRAERGIELGRLEQLVGCTSLFSALERQIAIRSWSILGFFMTLLWLLSPLGGQSALRLLGTESRTATFNESMNYLNSNSHLNSTMSSETAAESSRAAWSSIFLTALLSSTKYQNTPMDLWGNVKLPPWRAVSNFSDLGNGWREVDHTANEGNGSYASLIGVPVAGMSNGAANFTFKARQWDVTCDNISRTDQNHTNFGPLTSTWRLNSTHEPWTYCTEYPCAVHLMSLANMYSMEYTTADCNFEYIYVEAKTKCNNKDCQIDYLRKLDPYTDGYTLYNDLVDTRQDIMIGSLSYIVTADNSGVDYAGQGQSTNAERWLYNPYNFMGLSYTDVALYELSPETFSTRLNILFNTFFQSTYSSQALSGIFPSNLTSMADLKPPVTFNQTSAQIEITEFEVWKTDWKWFTALLVCSIVLLIAAYSGLVLKYITLAPDIIGYASSLTLLNPYVPVPTGGTTLFGLERAALLRHVRVKIGDVCPDEAVGAIAFAKADEGNVARLDRKRLYI